MRYAGKVIPSKLGVPMPLIPRTELKRKAYRGCIISYRVQRGVMAKCVTMTTSLVMKATGNHLIISTFLEKNSEPCLRFPLGSKLSMRRSFPCVQYRQSCTEKFHL